MIQRLFKFNVLFVLSFENDEIYFSKYYTPSVQIKDVSVLIDGKSSFDAPIKNKEEAYKKIIEMGRNRVCGIDNSLDFEYVSKYYKRIANRFEQTKWVRKF